MYDCIIQCSPLLPSGVTLAEVLEGSSASDVKDIVASLPDSGTISAAAMITAGVPHTAIWSAFIGHPTPSLCFPHFPLGPLLCPHTPPDCPAIPLSCYTDSSKDTFG